MQTNTLTPEYLQECRQALNKEQALSLRQTNNWSHVDKHQVHLDWDSLYKELAQHIDTLSPASPEIQAIMARHYTIASRFYPPTKEAYIGMSLLYAENEDMKTFHEAYHPEMITFLAKAMQIYALSQV